MRAGSISTSLTMARIDRYGARCSQVNVAEAEHHVAGLKYDFADVVAAVEAIDGNRYELPRPQ